MRKTVGQIAREAREARGLTLARVADRAGIAKAYVSMIENHRVPPPSAKVLASLEQALGLTGGELTEAAQWQAAPPLVKQTLQKQAAAVDQAHTLAQWLLDSTSRKAGGGRNLDRLFRTGELRKRVVETLGEIDSDPPAAGARADEPRPPLPLVPVINRIAAGYPSDFTDLGYPARMADEYIGCPELHDPDAFAARVVGESMLPDYREGDLVVFSPKAEVVDGCDCFVRLEPDHETTFKRIAFTGRRKDRIRLLPLNPRFKPCTYPREQVAGLYRAVWRMSRV